MKNFLLAGVDDGIGNPPPNPAYKGSIVNPALGDLGKETGLSFFQKLIPALVNILLVGGAVIFFFVLVTGAIQWISSGGDKQAIESARSKISNALIGIVILFAVFAIARLIEYFFGVSILTLDIGNLIIR